jgi:hypothetical protein
MVGVIDSFSSTRKSLTGSIGVNGAQLGQTANITTSADISLVPGVNVTGLTKFVNKYNIITNSAITVTLPSPSDVTIGWRCKIILTSSANTGILTINNHLAVMEAILNANMASVTLNYGSVELVLVNSGTNLWRAAYLIPRLQNGLGVLAGGTNLTPFYKPTNNGQYFSYSGASVNVNNTTAQAIPWTVGTLGRYVDSQYFNPAPASNTQLVPLRNFIAEVVAVVFIDNAGGATTANLTAEIFLNGGGVLQSGRVVNANSQTISSDIAIEFIIIMPFLSANFYELKIGKSLASVGTNPTNGTLTYISIREIAIIN